MPITRMLCVVLPTGFGAWLGWELVSGWGILPGFLAGNLGFAVGWYYGRKYVREVLD